MIAFGLICEGASEIRIIRYLTERYLGDEIVINPRQPETKGGKQTGFGGWLNVLNYCTVSNFENILATNDYIIIQIDTDACEEVGYDIKTRKEDGSIKSDEELYKEVISHILKNIPAEETIKYIEKIIFAICFNETECWLLPIYYSDNKKCSTTGCISKLNRQLAKDKLGIPEKDKNSPNAQKVYDKILKNIRKTEVIKEYSQYNYGFQKFIEQLDKIRNIPRIGDIYEGRVVSIMPYGAFINISPKIDGLLHISEIDWKRHENVEETGLKVGDIIQVQLIDIEPKTKKLRLSRKILLPQQKKG